LNYFDDQVETPLWQLIKPRVSALRGRPSLVVTTVFALLAALLVGASPATASTTEPVVVESEAVFGVETVTPETISRTGGTEVVLGGFGLDLVEQIVFDGSEITNSVLTGTTTLAFESLPVSSTESVVELELRGGDHTTSINLALADAEETVFDSVESGDPDASLGFIVKYKEIESLPGALSRAEVATDGAADLILGSDLGLGMRRIDVQDAIDASSADAVLQALESDPRIEWAEPVRRTRVAATFPSIPPDDANYGLQRELWDSFGIGLGTGTASVSPAWNLTLGSSSVVAVIDTGITDQVDLPSTQLVSGYDFVDLLPGARERDFADGAGTGARVVDLDGDYVDPITYGAPGWDPIPLDPGDWDLRASSWHGTKVAGLIAAETNNSVGIAGVGPNVRVQPVRALSWLGGTDADLAAAITWASGGSVAGVDPNATPADVINMSLGSEIPGPCPVAVQTAVDSAVSRGVVLVAAAGNSNLDAGDIWPANCNGVIAVGATTTGGKRDSYSNYGSTVDLSAPGDAYTTSKLGSFTPTSSTTRFDYVQGTSFAAPLVAGVAALLKSMDSGLTPTEIEQIMTTSVRSFSAGVCDPNPIKTCGSGIVDASLATVALNNSLSGLGISGTALSPSFNRMGNNYSASVDNNVSQAVITPTQSMSGGSLTVNGSSATSGVAARVDLVVGSNVVDIVSTGPGGYGSVTYSVTITRAGATPPSPPSPSPDSGGGSSETPVETPAGGLAISGFLPASGSTAGGTVVTVYGSGLTGVTRVLFGTAEAQIVRVINDGAVQVLTPPGRAGSYTVTVVAGGSTLTSPGLYTFVTPVPQPEDRIRVVNTTGGVERVVVVSGEAPYRPTVTMKKDVGRTISTAPKVKVGVGVVVTPRVKGLPKSKKFGVAMLVPGADPGTQRMFMGTVRTNKYGVTILPAARATEAGAYTYRITRKKSGSYYVQLRARP